MLRMIKLCNGMTGDFSVIITDASDADLVTQLQSRMKKEYDKAPMDDEWDVLHERGCYIDVLGCSDDGTMDESYSTKIDATFYLENYYPDCTDEWNEHGKMVGIVTAFGNAEYSLWKGFTLSEEDESAIRDILSKYDTDGDCIYGTKEEIIEEL